MYLFKTNKSFIYIIILVGAIYTFTYLDALFFHILPFHKFFFDSFFSYLDEELGIDEMLGVINLFLSCLLLYLLKFITNVLVKYSLGSLFMLFGIIHLFVTCTVIFTWLATS